MKKAVAIINPILASSKYLLLTVVLFFAALLLGQFLLKAFNIDASLTSNLRQSIVPFVCTAAVSMFVIKKFSSGKK